MNSIRRSQLFFLFIILMGRVSGLNAQNLETHPMRGFMPNMDQLSSPADNIDVASGKLKLQIPLASLPRGKGGTGFNLNLEYDSRIYDLDQHIDRVCCDVFGQPQDYKYAPLIPQTSTGGWNYNIFNYRIESEYKKFAKPAVDGTTGCDFQDALAVRYRVFLPDGSGHMLHLKGYEWRDTSFSGYNSIYMTGTRVNFCAELWDHINYGDWLYYYTNDGSYLRLEVYLGSNSSIPRQTLYLPDGSRIAGDSGNYTQYDANGNYLRVYAFFDTINHTRIEDNSGNQITIDHSAAVSGDRMRDIIHVKGPNSEDVQYAVDWQIISIGGPNRPYLYGYNPILGLTYGNIDYQFKFVKYVHLPHPQGSSNVFPALTQAPQVSDSYEFRYWGNAPDPEDTEPFVPGYGMLNYMRMPSGAKYRYYYTLGDWMQVANFYYAETISSKSFISKKKLTYTDPHTGNDASLVWQFAQDNISYVNTIINPDGGKIKYTYAGKGTGNWYDDLVSKIEELDVNGAPKGKETKRFWATNTPYGFRDYNTIANNNYMQTEIVSIRNAAGALTKSAITSFVYDKNGNMRTKTEYDWVAPGAGGSTIKRKTESNYYVVTQDSTNYTIVDDANAYWNSGMVGAPRRLNAVKRQTIYEGASTAKAAAEYIYDDPYTKGNVRYEKRWDSVKSSSLPALGNLSAANSQVMEMQYDSYGNLTDKFEGGAQTHITYDASASLVTQVETAYGTTAQRTMKYEWLNGVALWKKLDFDNNLWTEYAYDNVGRQISVIDKDASGGNLRKTTTEYDDVARKVTVKNDLKNFNDQLLESRTYYDPVGRAYFAQKSDGSPLTSAADGIKTNTYYIYTPGGKRVISSSPYRTLSDATLEWTCTQSDVFNRVTAVAMFKGSTPPGDCGSTMNRTGVTTTVFDADDKGSATTVTDPAGKARKQSADVLGRLVQVVEDPSNGVPPSELNYQTNYAYDILGNLTQVAQGVQTRTFTYSSLGRLLSANNPESGIITYAYYDNGDLQTKTDARGIIATMSYDPLHRILTKSYSSNSAPTVNYEYYLTGNASSPNIGQLRSVSSSVGSAIYTYNQWGKVAASTHSIAGLTGAATFTYDYYVSGALKNERYPSGRLVNYDVDDAGRTNKVYVAGKTYADATGSAADVFTPDGRMKRMLLGNNRWETHDYRTPGIPTIYKLGTAQGSGDITQLEYGFHAAQNNGNVQSQTILRGAGNTWIQNYTYDALNRVATVSESAGQTWNQTYGYDRFGNRYISTASNIALESHEPALPAQFNTANNRLTMTGVTYDAVGNQTYYAPYALSYDAENRNTGVSASGNPYVTFSYDGDGRRVKKLVHGGATSYYVYDALGQMIAEYSNQAPAITGTTYMFTDMLGSVRTITDQNGTVVECYDYLPFGRLIPSSVNGRNSVGCHPINPDTTLTSRTPRKFTGKERDAETGLDFFLARYYSAAQGRFMNPDIAGPRLYDPQSFNKYNYTRNNPLKRIDPDGMYDEDVHYDLTYALAYAAGFGDAQARGIACFDQHVDDNTFSSAGWGIGDARQQRVNRLYHFPTRERLGALEANMVNDPTVKNFGIFLHVFQDSISHAGYDNMVWGHASGGFDVDKTWKRPELAYNMAWTTYNVWLPLMRQLQPKLILYPAVPWKLIDASVQNFVNASNDALKSASISIITTITDNYRKEQEKKEHAAKAGAFCTDSFEQTLGW
jgi:RHS repeat-associated protein